MRLNIDAVRIDGTYRAGAGADLTLVLDRDWVGVPVLTYGIAGSIPATTATGPTALWVLTPTQLDLIATFAQGMAGTTCDIVEGAGDEARIVATGVLTRKARGDGARSQMGPFTVVTGRPGVKGDPGVVVGTDEPVLGAGEVVLWVDTSDGNITLNLVTGD